MSVRLSMDYYGMTGSDLDYLNGKDDVPKKNQDDSSSSSSESDKENDAPMTKAQGKRKAPSHHPAQSSSFASKKPRVHVDIGDDSDSVAQSLGNFLKLVKKSPEQAARMLYALEKTSDKVDSLYNQVTALTNAVTKLRADIAESKATPLQYPPPPKAPRTPEERVLLRWDEVHKKDQEVEEKKKNRSKTQVKLTKSNTSSRVTSDNEDNEDDDDDIDLPSKAHGKKEKAEPHTWSRDWYVDRNGEWVGGIECAAAAEHLRDTYQGWHNEGKLNVVVQTWNQVSGNLKISSCIVTEAAFPNLGRCSLHWKFLAFARHVYHSWRTKFLDTLKKLPAKKAKFDAKQGKGRGTVKFLQTPGAATSATSSTLQQVKQEHVQLPTPPSGQGLFKMPGLPPVTPASEPLSIDVSMDDASFDADYSPLTESQLPITVKNTPTPAARHGPQANNAKTLFTFGTGGLHLPSYSIPKPSALVSKALPVTDQSTIPIDPQLQDASSSLPPPNLQGQPSSGSPQAHVAVAMQSVTAQLMPATAQGSALIFQPGSAQHSVVIEVPAVAQAPAILQAPAVVQAPATVVPVPTAFQAPAIQAPATIVPVPVVPASTVVQAPTVVQTPTVVVQAPAVVQAPGALDGGIYQPNRTTYSGRNFYGWFWKKSNPKGRTPANKMGWDALGHQRRAQWDAKASEWKQMGKSIDKEAIAELQTGLGI